MNGLVFSDLLLRCNPPKNCRAHLRIELVVGDLTRAIQVSLVNGFESGLLIKTISNRGWRYGLSARLVRNRRARVGAVTERVLRRVDVPAGGKRAARVVLCSRLLLDYSTRQVA